MFKFGCVVGNLITIDSADVELIDKSKYPKSYPSVNPKIKSFSLINRGDMDIKVIINEGEELTIKSNEGISVGSYLDVYSCIVKTSGATVHWCGIL